MLGQAGPTLEKQIARSDPPGDHRPAKLDSERREPMRCELAEGGDGPRALSIAASSGAAGSPFTPLSLAGRSCRRPGSMAARSGGALSGRAKCRALSGTQRRSTTRDPASCLRHIPAEGRARSFAEVSKVVPKHLPDPRIRLHQVAAEDGLLIFSHYLSQIRRRA